MTKTPRIFIALSIAFSLQVCASAILAPAAHASSIYDNAWNGTDTLTVSPSSNWNIPDVDITNSWSSYILNSPVFSESDKQYFRDCIDSGTWAVTQENIPLTNYMGSNYSGRKDVIVQCSTDKANTTYEFNNYGNNQHANIYMNGAAGSKQYLIAYLPNGYGSSPPGVYAYLVSSPSAYISLQGTDDYGNEYLGFLINGTVNYPSGYAGVTIPSTYTPIVPLDMYFTYSVSGYSAQFHNVTDLADVSFCYWEINLDPDLNDDDEDIQLATTDNCTDLNYTFEQKGTYTVNIKATKYGIDYQASANVIIDGSTYTGYGNQAGGDYDSMYEDCDTTDIPCHLRNFVKWLFIPDTRFISQQWSSLIDKMTTALGFLYTPIDFISNFFQLAVANSNNVTGTTCDIGNITIFGASAHIRLCSWRYQFPQLWSYMQLAIQGGIAFSLVFVFWRKFMAIFGDYLEDYEEDDDEVYRSPMVSHHKNSYMRGNDGSRKHGL